MDAEQTAKSNPASFSAVQSGTGCRGSGASIPMAAHQAMTFFRALPRCGFTRARYGMSNSGRGVGPTFWYGTWGRLRRADPTRAGMRVADIPMDFSFI
ncbi:hypothetical protein GCM10009527_038330 [Actinomadura nitritigenes]